MHLFYSLPVTKRRQLRWLGCFIISEHIRQCFSELSMKLKRVWTEKLSLMRVLNK